jgi:hypothetical protein
LFRGEVILVRSLPWKSKSSYLCLNPYEKEIKIYEDKESYPQYPKERLQISQAKLKAMSKEEKSWFMKDGLSYFTISSITKAATKYVFGCYFEETVKRWVSAMSECLKIINNYSNTLNKYKQN